MSDLSGTRRDVLRRGAAAIGAATIVSNAGCLGILGGGGYLQWLPEPGTIGDDDHYGFNMLEYSSLEEYEDEFSSDTDLDSIEARWAPADIDWEDVSMLLLFNGMQVIEGEFEKESIIDDLDDEDFDDEDEYEGFQVMLSEDESVAAAVSDDVFVRAGFGGARDDAEGALEDVIDTSNGEEDRYVDDNEAFGELTDKLDTEHVVSGSTMEAVDDGEPERGRFENQVADGQTLNIDGETTEGKWVIVFEEEDDVDVGDVEDWVETSQDNDGRFEDWDDVEVGSNGRSAIVEATADTDDVI